MKSRTKRITSFLLALVLAVTLMPVGNAAVKAADFNENSASTITLGQKVTGTISKTNELFVYKLTLPSSGKVQIKGSANMKGIRLYLYDQNKTDDSIWYKEPYRASANQPTAISESVCLASGTYYFLVKKCYPSGEEYYGDFNFTVTLTSSNETFKEVSWGSNNTFSTANTIAVDGRTIKGQIAINDELDYFKFTLPSSGKVQIRVSANMKGIRLYLYDQNKTDDPLRSKEPYRASENQPTEINESLFLTSGTYYYLVKKCYPSGEEYYGDYNFSIKFTSSGESFAEGSGGWNNSTFGASKISLGKTYKGQLALNDEVDVYQIKVPATKFVVVKTTTEPRSNLVGMCVNLLDSKGESIWQSEPWKDKNLGLVNFSRETLLKKGTYYVSVKKCYPSSEEYYGDYKLNVSIKNIKSLPKMSFSSYGTSGGKKSIKLSWSKRDDVSGYQIRYSKKKNMKGAKTITINKPGTSTRTIKKLSKRKYYYVQIRVYSNYGVKKAYSSWSKAMKIKTS